jgi:hypothetical protein
MEITGAIREPAGRRLERIHLDLVRARMPREQLDRIEAIGSIKVREHGTVVALATVTADAYDSLAGALGRSEFRQLVVSVRNLKRGRGRIDGISLNAKPIEL